ncbi:DUF4493 domain-containing protein [Ekhidna sp.]
MKNIYAFLFFIITGFIISSCEEDVLQTPISEGFLSFDIGIMIEESVAGRTQTVNTDDFKVSIFTSDSVLVLDIPRLADAPDSLSLPVGNYYAEASSNNQVNAAFENPFFFGSSSIFSVSQGGFQSVIIDTELVNTQVSFVFSQNVTQGFDIYEGAVKVRNTSDSLFYQTGETRSGYFAPKPLDIRARIAYYQVDSTLVEKTFTASIDNPKPRTHYRLNLDATIEGGQISIQINVDESVDVIDLFPNDNLNAVFGGSEDDVATEIIETSDGGYLVAGTANSHDGDFAGVQGKSDGFVLKFDINGQIQWKKLIGNSFADAINSVAETSDGGYILGGYTASSPFAPADVWIVKLDDNGNIQWQRSFGGSRFDIAVSVVQTLDGGYIFAGHSNSLDGDLFVNLGGYDYWIVKLTDTGAIQWQKSYGGTSNDFAVVIRQTSDGGFYVGGSSLSRDGNVSIPIGLYDFWILRLDPQGNLLWNKSNGSTRSDRISDLELTDDGGLVVVGSSESLVGLGVDFLLIKMSSTGTVQLKKSYGGTDNEFPSSVQVLPGNGYLISGDSFSSDGDLPSNKGRFDLWSIEVDYMGNLLTSRTYGGSNQDQAGRSIKRADGTYLTVGASASSDGDVPKNRGIYDIWVFETDKNGNL